MAYLRYLIFLFASSMVIKIPLMALFHGLYLLITGDPWIESVSDVFVNITLLEIFFFIPLYLIYLPLFIYNIKTNRIEARFMYWDMSMICLIICPLTFGVLLNHEGAWVALSAAVFIATYFILTAILHLRFCRPYILGDEYRSPRDMDKTLPEYAAWQEKIDTLTKDRQENTPSFTRKSRRKKQSRKHKAE